MGGSFILPWHALERERMIFSFSFRQGTGESAEGEGQKKGDIPLGLYLNGSIL
jgi:hypothetical protein